MATVVLVGTLDTKGPEHAFVRDRLRGHGVDVVLVDTGVLGSPGIGPDVTRDEVARAGGADLEALAAAGDRGAAMAAMGRGAAAVLRRLHEEGRLDAALALGGSGGSSVAAEAMRALPVGVPKVLVSTMAAGDVSAYVGGADLTLMYSVVDVAGLNRVSARVLANAAAAAAGMATAPPLEHGEARPLVAASMFGVTTPCVTAARERLEELGYEVLVFHATGAGGRSLEALAAGGHLAGVLDVTTTELADELAGGVLSAGPERVEAAGAAGVPQVVSLGALDMVNFGPAETVPERYSGRLLHRHNPTVTLMRTTPDECAELGRTLARKLNAARGPVVLFVPLRGVSALSVAGAAFHDPEADAALVEALRDALDPGVERHELDADVNDPAFARALADRLDELVRAAA